jgi:hypothetical protein
VDLYALGVIVYELLTGRVPFDGETTGEILMKHLSEKPDLSPLPERLRPVVARALEKDPLRRTADAAQLLAEFQSAVRGLESRNVPQEIPSDSFLPRRLPETRPSNEPRRIPVAAAAAYEHPRAATAAATGGNGTGGNGAGQHAAGGTFNAAAYGRPASVRTTAPTTSSAEPWYQQHAHWLKTAAIVVVVLALLRPPALAALSEFVFVCGIFGALGYGFYRLVLFLNPAPPQHATRGTDNPVRLRPTTQAADNAPRTVPIHQSPPPVRHHRAYPLTPYTLRAIPWRQRMADLTGSMTFAVLCTAVITAGLAAVTPLLPDASSIGLFGLTTLLAAWAVLVPSKLWEGRRVDSLPRRMSLLALGAAVGLGAAWLDSTLMVELSPEAHALGGGTLIDHIGSHRLSDGYEPTMAGYLVFFAGLLASRRWWWHADSFRPKRYRIGSALLTLLAAFVLTAVFPFPQTWGMIWAIAISSVVQLSALWIPPEQRPQVMEGQVT